MRNAALVAHYGSKPENFARLILTCQRTISAKFGTQFQPYALEQVHATLVSLKRTDESVMHNLNFAHYRNQRRTMDFAGFLTYVRSTNEFPLQIQIGGFQRQASPFMSRGLSPYKRTFSIRGDKAVIVGWSITDNPDHSNFDYPLALEQIRQAFQTFNILHTYHALPTDVDNDFYLRLGLFETTALDADLKTELEETVRTMLSASEPVIVPVSTADLSLVSYEHETLPLETTRVWPLTDSKLTRDTMLTLYQ